ncbi:hypothetical protein Tco_1156335 [Tanacetum coccineum]
MQPVAPPSPDYIQARGSSTTPPASSPKTRDEREPMFIQEHDHGIRCQSLYTLGWCDDEDEDKDEEEEEEHLAPADSAIVVPTIEPVSPPEGIEPVIPPPSIDITIDSRITVWPQASISLPLEAEVERLLAMTTPSPSPPILLSPPSTGERLARIDPLRPFIDVFSAALPSPPIHHLTISIILTPIDHTGCFRVRAGHLRKRLCLSTLGSKYEIGESFTTRPTRDRGVDYGFVSTVDAEVRRQGISKVGYGIRDTWVDPAEAVPEIAPMTVGEDSRSRISQRVDMDSQRVDLLMGDRMTLQETVWMVEEEAYASSMRLGSLDKIEIRGPLQGASDPHVHHVVCKRDHYPAYQSQLQLAKALGTDGRDSPCDERHEARYGRTVDHQDASGDADSHI